MAPERGRAAASIGFAAGCLLAAVAYTVQRLVDAVDEPPLSAVQATATIPYFWRVAGSVVAGTCGGLLAGVAVALDPGDTRVAFGIKALSAVALPLGVALAAAMLAVP